MTEKNKTSRMRNAINRDVLLIWVVNTGFFSSLMNNLTMILENGAMCGVTDVNLCLPVCHGLTQATCRVLDLFRTELVRRNNQK